MHDLSEVELDPNDIDYDYFTKDDGQELRALIDETNALSKTLFKKYSHLQEKITKVPTSPFASERVMSLPLMFFIL